MTSRAPSKDLTATSLATFTAYGLTSLALASAWHVKVSSGIWIINALAAAIGIATGAWSITVAGDEANGNRLGRMVAEIKLKRKTEITDKPASRKSAP